MTLTPLEKKLRQALLVAHNYMDGYTGVEAGADQEQVRAALAEAEAKEREPEGPGGSTWYE